MANKKKIVICWNDNGYADKLNEAFSTSNDYEVTVCRNFGELENAVYSCKGKTRRKKRYDGFVVLCELQWNHESSGGKLNFSEFQGVALVQVFLRRTLGLRMPVVFASFMEAKEIVKQKPDYSIIMTPALQHEFVRLPASHKALLEPLASMRIMSDTELVYTQMQYCDLYGLLRQIKHNVEGHLEQKEKYRNQIRYVIEKQFKDVSDYLSLVKECESADDLSAFCDQLLNRLLNESPHIENENDIDLDYACRYKSKQISLLILEDDCNDESVQNFVDYIKKKNEEYEKKGDDIFFLFRVPVIARSKEEFERLIIEGKYGIVSFDIVICDIEIKNSDGFLVSLGFNMIESIIKLKKSPIYYIVTNVSRSFYDQIKKEYISRIRLKKEVFGTEESIRTFLYGVKERYEQKKSIDKDTLTKHENLFNELIKYVKNDEYSFIYKYKNRDNSYSETITKYEELEKVVKTRCNELIKAFLLLFNNKGFAYDNGEIKNYCTFNDNCNKMRDYIRKYVGKGNDAWCNNYSGYDPISNKDLQNFTIRLILRRFYFYVREFVKKYGIDESVNAIQEQVKSSRKIVISDIACRAINTDCKALSLSIDVSKATGLKRVEKEAGKGLEEGYKDQTHCFDRILFFSEKREPEDVFYTAEEKDFISRLQKEKFVFNYNIKTKIAKIDL